ncbi:MAG: SH3 domain-containing protein [Cyanobacteria bacterium J06600_6]
MTKSIFLKRLSATAQFILGFILGISLIGGVTVTLVFAYYQKMSILPKKPVFPEAEISSAETDPDPVETEIEPLESNTNSEPEFESRPAVIDPPPEAELPANAYRATVTWPQGLSLRAEPALDAERIGGIETKATIFILENSADGKWQRVQLPWNGQTGWVKAGNTKKL